MQRLIYLDIAKAICIILVVIGHYCPENSPGWWMYINRAIYTFHMPLFMFASGFIYIATQKYESYRSFILRKIKRLMIPYFTTSVLVITIKLLMQNGAYVQHPVTVISYLKMLYLPEAGYFLWFIWALWWMFVIVPLFRNRKSRLLLFACSVLFFLFPMNLPEVFCLKEFKKMFVFFMFGVTCFDFKTEFGKILSKIPEFVVYAVFILAEVISIVKWNKGYIWGGLHIIESILLACLGIWSVVLFSKRITRKSTGYDWLLSIGGSSYIIYLLHTTFEGFAKAVLNKIPLFTEMDNGLYFSLGAAVVVLCGIAIPVFLHRKVLNKFTLTRFLFGLK